MYVELYSELLQKFLSIENNISFDRLCGLGSKFLAANPEVRVRFPALSHFLSSSVFGTGSTQRHEDKRRATCSGAGLEN
jgi:hypothetical protein